ncbi:MAG: hypothetical protein IPM24_28495 [Bryobacterales bacterium]|nr:hypothetical protein [Bryobacterales bacterium]
MFVKISTDAGITGWGEMLEGRRESLRGRRVGSWRLPGRPGPAPRGVHHWQAIHRGAFYRGGPIKTAISSGIDWGPVGHHRQGLRRARCRKLLGGPTRDQIRVYGHGRPDEWCQRDEGWARRARGFRSSTTRAKDGGRSVRAVQGAPRTARQGVDIGVEFHGADSAATAMRLMKALEPFDPWFYEEIVQALNVD